MADFFVSLKPFVPALLAILIPLGIVTCLSAVFARISSNRVRYGTMFSLLVVPLAYAFYLDYAISKQNGWPVGSRECPWIDGTCEDDVFVTMFPLFIYPFWGTAMAMGYWLGKKWRNRRAAKQSLDL